MAQARLTFFCELDADALEAAFADETLLNDLVALGASVSMGLLDLSGQRASVVRLLNEAGVPVIAWLLLSEEQGYWFNTGNANLAATRYLDFRVWTAQHKLAWAGVGIDIEPDMNDARLLTGGDWRLLLPKLIHRTFDSESLRHAQMAYSALVAQMHADGYRVDSYIFPFIIDERRAGSTLLQRIAGLVDIPTDREVPMLYSSFMRPRGQGILWSYIQGAQSVGIGSTGGGVDVGGLDEVAPLNWDELSHDLRLATRRVDDIHIFSLEGCIQQDYLTRLKSFDWGRPVKPPIESAKQVGRIRRVLRVLLWASAHPTIVLGSLIGLLWLLPRLRGNRR